LESVGQTLLQLPWKQKKGGLKKKIDSFHQTSRNFVGIFTVVCGSFWGVEKIQNGGRSHGNQGTKWPPNTKILRFGRNLVSM
jgi:hypothetical protein